MITSIELQVISRILTTTDASEIDELCALDESYYSVFKPHIHFIYTHREQYNEIPDVFTFQTEFPEINLVQVTEPISYLLSEMRKNKKHIMLVETFNKIKDLGAGDVEDAWKYLSLQCERVAELNPNRPMDIVKDAKARSEQIIEFSKQTRIPTGFPEVDKLMYGGLSTIEELVIILARTNTGKAQPLYSKVLTPTGWKLMADVHVGDTLVGKDNDNGEVVAIFPQGIKDYYRITFDDGTYTDCCDDHLWEVRRLPTCNCVDITNCMHEVITTKDMRTSNSTTFCVDITYSVEYNSTFCVEEEIPAYLLGLLIGSMCSPSYNMQQTCTLYHILDNLTESGLASIIYSSFPGKSNYECLNFVRRKLHCYGLSDKLPNQLFIPTQYLTAPAYVRLQLLQGLLLIPQTSLCAGMYEFFTCSYELYRDFIDIAMSLGIKTDITNCVLDKKYYTCRISNLINYTRQHRVVKSIEYMGKTQCQCILLNNKSHTYLTDNYIVTHNTWVCMKMMESAQKSGFPVVYYSPEMQASYLGTRFDTWRGKFKNSELIQGKYDVPYMNYIDDLSHSETPAFVIEDKDIPEGVSVRSLEPIVKKYGIQLLIIDGMSYLHDDKRASNDSERYKNICMDLFRLSKKYGCAVVVAAQANRETRNRLDEKGDPFPNLYNVESSDHPGRIATQAFSLRQVFDRHVLDIRLEKSRMANNQKPILSYSWDPNTGNMQYLPGSADEDPTQSVNTPIVDLPITTIHTTEDTELLEDNLEDIDDDIEF